MKSTPSQRQQIHRLTGYDVQLKEELVYQITGDRKKTSTMDLTPTQAQALINKLTTNWAAFDKENKQHKYILSLLRQMGWTVEQPRWGTVADLARFSEWLKSRRSPIIKPLLSMTTEETSKVIYALEGILKSTYK